MKWRIVDTSAGVANRIASVLGVLSVADVMASSRTGAARYASPAGDVRMARCDRRATLSRMAVIACDACGGKMNDGLAVCPHCGARRAATGRPTLSGDEIRALLATDPSAR